MLLPLAANGSGDDHKDCRGERDPFEGSRACREEMTSAGPLARLKVTVPGLESCHDSLYRYYYYYYYYYYYFYSCRADICWKSNIKFNRVGC